MKISDLQENTAVYTTEYVINKDSGIVYVSLDDDGDLHVFSKEGANVEKAMLVTFKNIISMDNSLLSIGNIDKGEKFYRDNKNSPWIKIN